MSRPAKFSITLAATAALLLAVLVPSAPAFAPAGAASLLTEGSTDLGAVTQQRSVVLALRPSDAAGLRAFDAEAGHPTLAPHQFAARFGPTPASVAAVESWAAAQGLSATSVSADGLLVRVTGSTATLGTALGVTFERFRAADGSEYVSSTGTAALPASLADDVSAIVGLSDLARTHGYIAHPAAALPGVSYPASYGPKQFWSLYDASASQTGAGQQVSVIAAGDLSQPKRTWRHSRATSVSRASPGTRSTSAHRPLKPKATTSGTSTRSTRPASHPASHRWTCTTAPRSKTATILETIDRWVTDDTTTQASFSAGECELLADAAGFVESLDTVLAEAAAQGQTLFTASGDTGSQCPALVAENGVPVGLPGVDYPASSPYAIGAGGTSVLGADEEIGWYAGGGGTSLLESAPAWQQNAGGSLTGVKRGVPDVSLDADPESGYEVIIAGKEEVIGGTSASAPSWQGIWTRAQGAHGGTLGFAGPVIYETEPADAFNDITLGDNGLFPCTPGWDYVTGRGTPNIAAFVAGA